MKTKLILVTALFAAAILFAAAVFYISGLSADPQSKQAELIIAANEIEQLANAGRSGEAAEKALELKLLIQEAENRRTGSIHTITLCGISLVFLLLVSGYVYAAILRPFDKMKDFAQKIAQGNFDLPLDYERSNYFGTFTWAFDSMRKEITKARSCEREAIENNKTVIATLSHDIKTPIASIRAYAEGLEANLDATPEKRAKYLSVLMRKCDEVSGLTNDLFLHSLADLDKLKIFCEPFEICGFMETAILEIAAEQNDVRFHRPNFQAILSADKSRLMQVTENLINNARKYAESDIDVTLILLKGNVEIHFRDYGMGIPDEDMPFIFDKFYRGRNCGSKQGSGLGLYIVKYILKQMGGTILLHNHTDGLEAIVSLPVADSV